MAKSAALPTANQLPQRSRRFRTLTSIRRDTALSSATAGEASRWSLTCRQAIVGDVALPGVCKRRSIRSSTQFVCAVERHQLPVEAAHLVHRGPQAVAGERGIGNEPIAPVADLVCRLLLEKKKKKAKKTKHY